MPTTRTRALWHFGHSCGVGGVGTREAIPRPLQVRFLSHQAGIPGSITGVPPPMFYLDAPGYSFAALRVGSVRRDADRRPSAIRAAGSPRIGARNRSTDVDASPTAPCANAGTNARAPVPSWSNRSGCNARNPSRRSGGQRHWNSFVRPERMSACMRTESRCESTCCGHESLLKAGDIDWSIKTTRHGYRRQN